MIHKGLNIYVCTLSIQLFLDDVNKNDDIIIVHF